MWQGFGVGPHMPWFPSPFVILSYTCRDSIGEKGGWFRAHWVDGISGRTDVIRIACSARTGPKRDIGAADGTTS